jgi:hypothetical protein
MYIFIVTHITGETVIDYGSFEKIIGAYSTKRKAVKARADYARNQELINNDEYIRLLTTKRKLYFFDSVSGSVCIKKVSLDEEI